MSQDPLHESQLQALIALARFELLGEFPPKDQLATINGSGVASVVLIDNGNGGTQAGGIAATTERAVAAMAGLDSLGRTLARAHWDKNGRASFAGREHVVYTTTEDGTEKFGVIRFAFARRDDFHDTVTFSANVHWDSLPLPRPLSEIFEDYGRQPKGAASDPAPALDGHEPAAND